MGVKGNLPSQAWSEVTYALGVTAALALGWGLLGDRWLAFLPIAFMALASLEPRNDERVALVDEMLHQVIRDAAVQDDGVQASLA